MNVLITFEFKEQVQINSIEELQTMLIGASEFNGDGEKLKIEVKNEK